MLKMYKQHIFHNFLFHIENTMILYVENLKLSYIKTSDLVAHKYFLS